MKPINSSKTVTEALDAARTFSVNHNINLIDESMLAIGILKTDETIKKILAQESTALIDQLTGYAKQIGGIPPTGENIPLTREAEHVLHFARQYALCNSFDGVEAGHILLALLSYDNGVNDIFQHLGWMFHNVLEEINKGSAGQLAAHQLTYELKPSRTKPVSFLTRFFLSSTKRDKRARQFLNEIRTLCRFRKYEGCLQLCYVLSDLQRSFARSAPYIILSLYSEKRHQEAIAFFEQHQPTDDFSLINIALSYSATGNFETAITLYSRIKSRTAITYNNLGFVLAGAKRHQEAINALNQSIAQDPDYAFAYNNRGFAQLQLGNISEAKQSILHSLKLNKGNSYAYKNLALVFIAEKNKPAAQKALEKAIFYKYREAYGNDIDDVATKLINM